MSSEPTFQKNAVRPIYNITPFTLLDYPDKAACIIWFAGCNMRCQYCYNPDIVRGKGKLFLGQALEFIVSRVGLLDGVVFSGGECTLHKGMYALAKATKDLGLSVKIDTNGALPERIQYLIENQLVDYIALDFKALPENFQTITGSAIFEEFEQSLTLLIKSPIPFEVRTTVHQNLFTREELKRMVKYLEDQGYRGNYYIQQFFNDAPTLGNLGTSAPLPNIAELSTPNIKVIERNH